MKIMRAWCYGLVLASISLVLGGCQKKLNNPQLEIIEEDDAYGQRQVKVFAPKDAEVDQFKQWSKEIREFENSEKPVNVSFFPRETQSSYYLDIIAQYVEKKNWLWVRKKTTLSGVTVD